MNSSTPGLPVHHQLPESAQTHVHWVGMPSNHLILCRPLLLLPSIFPRIRVFSNESALHIRWPKYWSFSFNICPSNEHSGPISLGWTGWISLLSKGLSKVFSNTTVQKHQFFGTQLYLWSNSHIHVSAVLKEAKLLYSWASGLFVVLYGKEPMDPLVIFPLPHISCNYQNIWYYVSMNKTFCKSSDTGPNKALLSWKSILYQEYVSITVKLNCFCFQNGMVQHS